LHAHVPIDDDEAVKTVDRIIALPGEAVACTVGYLKIQGLRMRAQQMLGAGFDARAFHAEIVKDGAIPLDVLDTKLNSWLAGGALAGVASAGNPPGGAPD